MKKLLCLCVVATALSYVLGQIVIDGPCSRFQVTSLQPFSLPKFLGKWYVWATIDYNEDVGQDCLVDWYKVNSITGNVDSTEWGKNLTTNVPQVEHDSYNFTQSDVGYYEFDGTVGVQIPVIDYDTHYIEFNCIDLPYGKAFYYVGIFTRAVFPSDDVKAQIENYCNEHGINMTQLRRVNHNDIRCYLGLDLEIILNK